MSTEQNKAFVRRQIDELWNKGNLDFAYKGFASNFVKHDPLATEEARGPEGFNQGVAMMREAFPDFHAEVVDQIAEGDKVTTRYVFSGTHEAEFEGLPPTGNQIKVAGTGVDRFSKGKIVETWEAYDTLGLMQQLGLVLVPGPKLLARMLVHQMKKLRSRLLTKG